MFSLIRIKNFDFNFFTSKFNLNERKMYNLSEKVVKIEIKHFLECIINLF